MSDKPFEAFPRNRHEASLKLLHICKQFVIDYYSKITSLGHFDNPYECAFIALHNFAGSEFAGLAFPDLSYDPDLIHLGKAFLTFLKKNMQIPAEEPFDKHNAKLIYDVLQVLTKLPEEELNISDDEFWQKLQKIQ